MQAGSSQPTTVSGALFGDKASLFDWLGGSPTSRGVRQILAAPVACCTMNLRPRLLAREVEAIEPIAAQPQNRPAHVSLDTDRSECSWRGLTQRIRFEFRRGRPLSEHS